MCYGFFVSITHKKQALVLYKKEKNSKRGKTCVTKFIFRHIIKIELKPSVYL